MIEMPTIKGNLILEKNTVFEEDLIVNSCIRINFAITNILF